MNTPYLMGVDVGTSAIKAVIFDVKANEICSASTRVTLSHPKPGWTEKDMLEEWVSAKKSIQECLKKAKRKKIKPEDISAISFSGEGGGAWLIDHEGKPVRAAIIWLDGRANYIINNWQRDATYDTIHDETGWRMVTGYTPPIIKWLSEKEKNNLEKAKWNLWAKDWIKYLITGVACTDETDPSLGFFDLEKRNYNRKAFELYGLQEFERIFPPVIESWKVMGEVTGKAAKETGLRKGTPVTSGAWDITSTALGVNAINKGSACTILGTASVHEVAVDQPILDENRRWGCCCHCIPNTWLITSFAMLATGNLDWFIRNFSGTIEKQAKKSKLSIYQYCDKIVEQVPIGSEGVIYHPFLQGERAPFVKATARAQFIGLGDWHEWKHLLRAVYEGVAFSTLDNYQVLKDACIKIGFEIKEVSMAGGGSRSSTWCQILADCLGYTMNTPHITEFGARGAAINAGVGVGVYKDHKDAVRNIKVEKKFDPRPEATRKYTKLFQVYKSVYEALMDEWDRLNNVMTEIY